MVYYIVEGETMKQYLRNFSKYTPLIFNLINKDLKLKYRRSVLGFAWSILNPLLMMLVITAVFQNIFKNSIPNYPIYYLTGYILFTFMTGATNMAMTSVVNSSTLIKKAYIPKYIFPLEKALFGFVNMLLSFIAVIIVMLMLKVTFYPSFFLFLVPMLYTLVFVIGLGMFLAAATVFFRDVIHLYGIVTVAWTYLTPIFYPAERLPDFMTPVLNFNPLYHYISYMRSLVLHGQIPDLKANLICISFSLVMLIIGLATFKKTQDKFILYM